MKIRNLLLIICLSLGLATCKKETNRDNGDTLENLATLLNIQDAAMDIYNDTISATSDTLRALNAAGQWLIEQPEVAEAFYWSRNLIEIHYVSGMRSSISFIAADANGHLTRGSGSGALKQYGTLEKKIIRNNKVLVVNPFTDDFYQGHYNKRPQFNGGPQTLDVYIVNDDSVSYDVLNSFGEYGFIIINTHGFPWGFVLQQYDRDEIPGSWTREKVAELINTKMPGGAYPIEKFTSGELEMMNLRNLKTGYSYVGVIVTEKFIRNADFSLDGAVVFNNSCWSGHTATGPTENNLSEAFRSKDVATYYGYAFDNLNSGVVNGDFANDMEDSLIVNLVVRADTTGVAHLINDVTRQFTRYTHDNDDAGLPLRIVRGTVFQPSPPGDPLYFVQFFEPNYSYDKCGDSITDSRDGQKYATVCIGDQVWMSQNLNYAGPGACFNNSSGFCNTYGRLYTWAELTGGTSSNSSPSGIKGICPNGWHIPSLAEWQTLITYAGGELAAGKKLKSTSSLWEGSDPVTDEYGFGVLPAGESDIDPDTHEYDYYNDGSTSAIWTSYKNGQPYYIYFVVSDYTGTFQGNDNNRFSCRCVKD